MIQSIKMFSLTVVTLILAGSAVRAESVIKIKDPCLRPCPRSMRPVCASNGQTYANDCLMQVESCRSDSNLEVMYEGHCHEVEVEEQQSLLDEDPSQMELEGEEEVVVERPACNMACPFIYLPVCASDGNDYPNECVFNAANCMVGGVLSIVHPGPCVRPEVGHLINRRDASADSRDDVRDECMRGCPRHYAPVCGSDGQTYANDCLFQIADCRAGGALTIVGRGRCEVANHESVNELDDEVEEDEDEEPERDECARPCNRIFRQVCASNGQTYANHCLFLIANCRVNNTLTVVSQGACPASRESSESSRPSPTIEDCMRGCTREYDPVCASDGTTHNNPCLFEIANCMASGTLTVASQGRCGDAPASTRRPGNTLDNDQDRGRPKDSSSRPRCSRRCPLNLDPICASNGKTYGNQCRFEYAKCKRRGALTIVQHSACEAGENTRRRPSRGRRCRRPCPLLLAPVCASNGRTYANTCLFNNANCRVSGALDITREGRC